MSHFNSKRKKCRFKRVVLISSFGAVLRMFGTVSFDVHGYCAKDMVFCLLQHLCRVLGLLTFLGHRNPPFPTTQYFSMLLMLVESGFPFIGGASTLFCPISGKIMQKYDETGDLIGDWWKVVLIPVYPSLPPELINKLTERTGKK